MGVILYKNIDIVIVKDGFSIRVGFGVVDVICEEFRLVFVLVFCDCLLFLMLSGVFFVFCCIILDMMLGFIYDVVVKFNIL